MFFFEVLFSAHLIEQPNVFVEATGGSEFFNKASIALRASKFFGVRLGFSTSSILPW
jgi:hypothetical protein